MKRVFLLLSLIFTLIANAQEVFYEGDFKTGLKPAMGITLTNQLSKNNEFIIKSVKGVNLQFHKLDAKGNVSNIDISSGINIAGSDSGNTYAQVMYGKIFELNSNDKTYKVSNKNASKLKNNYFKTWNFNDNYIVGLENEKGKEEINILKNNLFLLLYDFKKSSLKKVKIDMPNIERLKKNNEKSGFSIVKMTNDNFVMVTKLVGSDYKKCSVFLTTYDFNGKIINDKEIVIDTGSNFLLNSSNGAGELDFKQTSPAGKDIYKFDDEMFINNIFYDIYSDDFYIYGLYGNKTSRFNNKIEASGFYVYKFDGNGKMLWSNYNEIDKSYLLTKSFYPFLINNYIDYIGNDLCFFARADRLKHFIFFNIFDKETGKVKLQKEMEQDDKWKVKYFAVQFLGGGSKLKEFNDKLFDASTIATMYSNKNVLNYINSVISKKDIMFSSFILKDYFVLVESDNNNYFKFTKFKK
jgi:hypothetical protein